MARGAEKRKKTQPKKTRRPPRKSTMKKGRFKLVCCETLGVVLLNLFMMFSEMGIRLGFLRAARRGKSENENAYASACTLFSVLFFLVGVAQIWYFAFKGKQHLEAHHLIDTGLRKKRK